MIALNKKRQIDPDDRVLMINPCDLGAVETALRLKDLCAANRVTIVSVAPPQADGLLRRCLAMGATRAVRLWDETFLGVYNETVGIVLAAMLRMLETDLVFCGYKAHDDEMGYTGYQVAENLGFPFIQRAVKIQVPRKNCIVATTKLDGGGRERIEAGLPAVVGIEDGLVEPRYAGLTPLMNAFRSEVETVGLDTIGLTQRDLRSNLKHVGFSPPRPIVKKVFMPESHLPAPERLRQIINGGIAEKKETLVEGSDKELSRKFLRFINRLHV